MRKRCLKAGGIIYVVKVKPASFDWSDRISVVGTSDHAQPGTSEFILCEHRRDLCFSMLSTCLVLIYFFCTATTSKDTMIKTGGFLAGSGYGVLLLMALFQMMGVAIPVISLIGAITAIAGVVLVAVKFMLLFQRDSIIVILCIVTFIGLFLCFFGLFIGSIVSGIGDIITGISLGSLLLYFRSHNIFH